MNVRLLHLAMLPLILTAPSLAKADVLVLQSSAPAYVRGQRLADTATLDVPAGKRVDVLRPGGQTQSISGPRKLAVGDLTRGEAINEPLWKRMLEELKDDPRGGRSGAVRGVSR